MKWPWNKRESVARRVLGKRTRSPFARASSLRGVLTTRNLWLALRAAAGWLFRIRWKLLVIERYVFNEVLSHFLLGVLGFTIFMIITSIFTKRTNSRSQSHKLI